MKILGGFLISLPFIGIFAMCLYKTGLVETIKAFGFAMGITVILIAGIYCLTKGKY